MTDDYLNTAVRGSELLSGLEPEALDALMASGEIVSLKAGEALIREGEEGDAFFIIKQGYVDVLVKEFAETNASGSEDDVGSDAGPSSPDTGEAGPSTSDAANHRVIRSLGPGSILGEISLLCNRPRTATCIVDGSDFEAIRFSAPALRELMKRFPIIKQRLNEIAIPRAQETMRRLYA